MRTLIIGDLHHHTGTADEILAREPHDHVVFLGDYFDHFHDTPEHAQATALWVKDRISETRCKLLFGNHDLPYAFDATAFPFIYCSGYDRQKSEAIANVLDASDWEQFSAFAIVGPWLVSHAGFHRDLLPHHVVRSPSALLERCTRALESLRRREPDLLFAAGRDRGGRSEIGGITWCDWRRFEGVAGLHQIVGHTPSKDEPLRHWSPPNSTNYCIDYLYGHTYALVTDHHTVFKEFRDADHEALILENVDHSWLTSLPSTHA